MNSLDWLILITVLLAVILYGVYKSKTTKDLEGYFLSNRSMPWYLVLLGIMGTQASAVTYLTGPGQAYTDGMRFVQYYFGLPFAMIVISLFFVPVFAKLKVFTPYEFLEKRFDLKTRTLTSLLFLVSRGLSTGVSIYAPAIVLSAILGWNIYLTNVIMGGVLIIYTISGGARAVAHTQKIQMIIVFLSLFIIGWIAIDLIGNANGLSGIIDEAKGYGKMNVITTGQTANGFDWKDKYNIWSGLIGGFFLALSYFGTDHSQVGRYITAKNARESKKGLLMNGLVKVPMQFFILMLGVLIFVFYIHKKAPVYFDDSRVAAAKTSKDSALFTNITGAYDSARSAKNYAAADSQRVAYREQLNKTFPEQKSNDTNFIFLRFVKDNLPAGLTGLLFAMIFLSAWGSIAGALNSLAACTMVDFHKRIFRKDEDSVNDFKTSQWYTFLWGCFCIIIAMFAQNIGNSLIEAVNILGSIFYGVILGIFIVAFWIKYIRAQAVFIAAVISQIAIFAIYKADIISFLWLNVIGAVLVVIIGLLTQIFFRTRR